MVIYYLPIWFWKAIMFKLEIVLDLIQKCSFSKQEKVKDYPWVKTQVNSSLGHINVTLFFWARFSPCYQNHHCRIIILEPIMTKIQLFRFNNGMAFMATLVFVILAFQSRSTSANDVSARFWPLNHRKCRNMPKLCILSIVNT